MTSAGSRRPERGRFALAAGAFAPACWPRSLTDVRALLRTFIGRPLCAVDGVGAELSLERATSKVGFRGAEGRGGHATKCLA